MKASTWLVLFLIPTLFSCATGIAPKRVITVSVADGITSARVVEDINVVLAEVTTASDAPISFGDDGSIVVHEMTTDLQQYFGVTPAMLEEAAGDASLMDDLVALVLVQLQEYRDWPSKASPEYLEEISDDLQYLTPAEIRQIPGMMEETYQGALRVAAHYFPNAPIQITEATRCRAARYAATHEIVRAPHETGVIAFDIPFRSPAFSRQPSGPCPE